MPSAFPLVQTGRPSLAGASLIVALLIALLPPADADANEPEFALERFVVTENVVNLGPSPTPPISRAELASWADAAGMTPDEREVAEQLRRSLVSAYELVWLRAKERSTDLDWNSPLTSADSAAWHDALGEVDELYLRDRGALLEAFERDLRLVMTGDAEEKWERIDRARWRRDLVGRTAYDHRPAILLTDWVDPATATPEANEALADYTDQLDAILERADRAGRRALAVGMDYREAASRATSRRSTESYGVRNERVRNARLALLDALRVVMSAYDDVHELNRETLESLAPLLDEADTDAIRAAMRPRRAVRDAIASSIGSRFPPALVALQNATSAGVSTVELFNYSRSIAGRGGRTRLMPSVDPLTSEQLDEIDAISVWYREAIEELAADIARSPVPERGPSRGEGSHRVIVAGGGVAILRERADQANPQARIALERLRTDLERRQRDIENEAMDRLRAILNIDQRLTIAHL